jgi:hypothetical protein
MKRTWGLAGRKRSASLGHRLIHAGHRHLCIEVGAVAQAAIMIEAPCVLSRIDHQAVKGDHLDAPGVPAKFVRCNLFDEGNAFFE